jgi:hypothetical protein
LQIRDVDIEGLVGGRDIGGEPPAIARDREVADVEVGVEVERHAELARVQIDHQHLMLERAENRSPSSLQWSPAHHGPLMSRGLLPARSEITTPESR